MTLPVQAERPPRRSIAEPRGDATQTDRCAPFAVNGRFLTQRATGVQRYAREILRSLGERSAERGEYVEVLAPARNLGEAPHPSARVMPMSPASGHIWEQTTLAFRTSAPLLNLCNTAPAFGPRQVVCIHDANIFTQPDSYGLAFRTLYRTLQPWIARRAMRVTTVSKHAATELATYLGISSLAIEVLPDGHEHTLRWKASQSRMLLERPPGRPFVLLIGSRARHKNIALIVDLASALDSLGLDIWIAGGKDAIFASTALAAARNVRWLGVVTDDDLAALYGHALCLAFPSLTEGFGLPVLEAMALGCPVIASNRASVPEVCGSAGLIADAADPSSWLAHFRTLSQSRDLQADLSARGLEQARKFSWSRSAAGYLELFGR